MCETASTRLPPTKIHWSAEGSAVSSQRPFGDHASPCRRPSVLNTVRVCSPSKRRRAWPCTTASRPRRLPPEEEGGAVPSPAGEPPLPGEGSRAHVAQLEHVRTTGTRIEEDEL